MKPPVILITGSSGFIGSFLVGEAVGRNMNVYAGIRTGSSLKYLDFQGIHIVEFDFSSKEKVSDTLKKIEMESGGIEYIIHNAGITKAKNPNDYITINTRFTSNFLEAIKSSLKHIPKFIYISSLAAYGPGDPKTFEPVKNSDKPAPVTNYGRSKFLAEKIVTSQNLVPWIIVRPTAVYGPKEKEIFAVFKAVNKGLQPAIKNEKQRLTFIYVKDLVRAIIDLTISENKNKAYFVSDGDVHSNKVFAEHIKTIMHKKTFKINLSPTVLKIVAITMEGIYKMRGDTPGLNREKVDEMNQLNWTCDTEPLINDIAFVPQYNLEKGIAETISWYKEEKWL